MSSQFGTINGSFSTITSNAGQIPVVNAGEVETYNAKVNNFLSIDGHILSNANVASGGMPPQLPAAGGRTDRLRVEPSPDFNPNAFQTDPQFVGAATDVCGVVIFMQIGTGQQLKSVIRVTYGTPYPSNQPVDGFGRAPQPVVCISPQNTALDSVFVSASTNTFFEVTYRNPQITVDTTQSFSYIVMYPILGPPNDL